MDRGDSVRVLLSMAGVAEESAGGRDDGACDFEFAPWRLRRVEGTMAILVNPPCIVFEDDHLLVVNKPPGWNTHSPAPYAGEGIYEWLKNREPRWSKLAVIHRLDKETSGLLVFSKTTEANKSLTQQFTEGKVRKEYVLHSIDPPPKPKMVVRSTLKRAGERYMSERGSVSGADAETEFESIGKSAGHSVVVA